MTDTRHPWLQAEDIEHGTVHCVRATPEQVAARDPNQFSVVGTLAQSAQSFMITAKKNRELQEMLSRAMGDIGDARLMELSKTVITRSSRDTNTFIAALMYLSNQKGISIEVEDAVSRAWYALIMSGKYVPEVVPYDSGRQSEQTVLFCYGKSFPNTNGACVYVGVGGVLYDDIEFQFEEHTSDCGQASMIIMQAFARAMKDDAYVVQRIVRGWMFRQAGNGCNHDQINLHSRTDNRLTFPLSIAGIRMHITLQLPKVKK